MHDGPELVHGTCVALGGAAALIRGPSGSGKSDLALRFLFLARRGPAALAKPTLVADDQVLIRRVNDRLIGEAPATIRGKLEVRGVGIVELRASAEAELRLIVDLVGDAEIERLPDPGQSVRLLGLDIPSLRLAPMQASAPIKLALALASAGHT